LNFTNLATITSLTPGLSPPSYLFVFWNRDSNSSNQIPEQNRQTQFYELTLGAALKPYPEPFVSSFFSSKHDLFFQALNLPVFSSQLSF